MNKSLITPVSMTEIADEGQLFVCESFKNIPFLTKRFYLIRNIESGAHRGMHAHRKNVQTLFCLQGSVQIVLDDGKRREECVLHGPADGILLEAMIWHEMWEFSEDAILLVAASEPFEETDYIRDYDQFCREVNL